MLVCYSFKRYIINKNPWWYYLHNFRIHVRFKYSNCYCSIKYKTEMVIQTWQTAFYQIKLQYLNKKVLNLPNKIKRKTESIDPSVHCMTSIISVVKLWSDSFLFRIISSINQLFKCGWLCAPSLLKINETHDPLLGASLWGDSFSQ